LARGEGRGIATALIERAERQVVVHHPSMADEMPPEPVEIGGVRRGRLLDEHRAVVDRHRGIDRQAADQLGAGIGVSVWLPAMAGDPPHAAVSKARAAIARPPTLTLPHKGEGAIPRRSGVWA